MKIAIEAQRIFRKNKHGMDYVAIDIIRELQKTDFNNEYYILVNSGEDACLQPSSNVHIIEIKCPTYLLWEQYALPRMIKKIKPDLLHCTSNTAPILCNVPLVLTLHDIIFLEKESSTNKSTYQKLGRYYRRFVVPKILPKCRRIITVSNYEKNNISSVLNISDKKITTIYNSYNSYFKPKTISKDIINKYIDCDRYLFFLGNTDPKKNTQRVIKAYSIYLNQSKQKLPLLIADLDKEYIDSILKNENIENIKPYLYCPGYISNTDLCDIYNSAFAFLYPSLRESFGIPILEAMACGTPVITSNTSAIPEIAGEKALLVNPFKAEDIANEILNLEENHNLYKEQKEYGLSRTQLFSWEKSTEQLLNVYNDVMTK